MFIKIKKVTKILIKSYKNGYYIKIKNYYYIK